MQSISVTYKYGHIYEKINKIMISSSYKKNHIEFYCEVRNIIREFYDQKGFLTNSCNFSISNEQIMLLFSI